MKPFGSKRTYAKCIVVQAYAGKARKLKLTLKNHKADRQVNKALCNDVTY